MQPKFKVGDRIITISAEDPDYGQPTVPAGYTGTINEIDPDCRGQVGDSLIYSVRMDTVVPGLMDDHFLSRDTSDTPLLLLWEREMDLLPAVTAVTFDFLYGVGL